MTMRCGLCKTKIVARVVLLGNKRGLCETCARSVARAMIERVLYMIWPHSA